MNQDEAHKSFTNIEKIVQEQQPPFLTWVREQPEPDDTMVYQGAWSAQVQDFHSLRYLVSASYGFACKDEDFYKSKEKEEWEAEGARVVGLHMSKSIQLPVVKLQFKNGPVVVLRDNFHDWNISVVSEHPIKHNFFDVVATEDIDYCYFQGFPKEYEFGPYKDNNKQFSTYCRTNLERVWTFLFLMWHGYREEYLETN